MGIFKQQGLLFIFLLVIFLLNPFSKGFLIGYILIGYTYINGNFIVKNLDFDYLLLLVYSFIYAFVYYVIDMEQGMQYLIIYAFFPSTFYLLGKKMVKKGMSHIQLFYLLFFISSIFSLSAVISVVVNLRTGGFVQFDRSIPMFWDGKMMKATAMGAYLTFNMCIPAIIIANRKRLNLFFKVPALLLFLASLLSVFRLGSRTQLVICFLSILVALFYVMQKQNIKTNIKLISFLVVSIFLILTFAPIDLEADYFSVLGDRLKESDNAGSAGGRTERWTKSFANLFTKPLGWNLHEFGYSHNFWLDVARYGGVIPMFLLLVFTIRSGIHIKKAIQLHKSQLLFNSTVLVYSAASFLIFFMEPIMEGLFFLFVAFCIFQGIINAYLNTFKLEEGTDDSKHQ